MLEELLVSQSWTNKNLLMMSSGNFGGIDLTKLADKIVG
jgi:UDP-N-acetylmuramate: L-alanyl-gamma-D-glutamyl-meso-diaminopimelate ligase